MSTSIAFRLVRACAPKPLRRYYRKRQLIGRAAELARSTRDTADVSAAFDALWSYHEFRPLQIRKEAIELFELLAQERPTTICEIGAASGGTAFMFAKFASLDATVISVDLAFDDARRKAIRKFARQRQSIHCLAGDSHSPETQSRVVRLLKGRQLDVLLIDGDHSYEGARLDFEQYTPLVRPGGFVVLHDIVPSGFMRTGVFTGTDVGGVPTFWSEIAPAYARTSEIVENSEQDGYGIGVVRWPGSAKVLEDGALA
jgi:cephalosporin hydroxylase